MTHRTGLSDRGPADADSPSEPAQGTVACAGRREFFRGAGLAAAGAVLGTAIPFHRNLPLGFAPGALAAGGFVIAHKDGLTALGERPVNAETKPHLLNDDVTPTSRHFVRNNGLMPEDLNADAWRLRIDGLVENPMSLSISDLMRRFETVTRQLTIECAGNRRAFLIRRRRAASGRMAQSGVLNGPVSV